MTQINLDFNEKLKYIPKRQPLDFLFKNFNLNVKDVVLKNTKIGLVVKRFNGLNEYHMPICLNNFKLKK